MPAGMAGLAPSVLPEGAEGGASARGLAAALPGSKDSTSAFTMRPLGPDPVTSDRSMPRSLAMRRARGEAKIRSPDAPPEAPASEWISALGAASAPPASRP